MPSRFFRVPLEEIAYVRAILEGYDGVAVVTAQGPDRGEIELLIGEGLDEEAGEVTGRLRQETGMVEIERPSDWGKT